MRTRTLASVAALLATGTLLACQGDLPTSPGAPTSLRTSADAFGAPTTTGVVRGQLSGVVCGITVDEDVVQAGASFASGPAGTKTKGTGTLRATLTNPDNGKQLEWHSAGPSMHEITSVNPDGSFMIRETYSGLGPMLKESRGGVLFFNAGHAVIDGLITPLPGGGFEGQILDMTLDGPHPAQQGSPEFCAVVQGALL